MISSSVVPPSRLSIEITWLVLLPSRGAPASFEVPGCPNLRASDAICQWLPTVAVAEQHDKVWANPGSLAAADLVETDLHRLMVERSLGANAPSEVDCLEAGTVLLAEGPQLREDVALEGVAFFF
jgi:hypothetical protein